MPFIGHHHCQGEQDLLKAAGTPMIKAFPVIASPKLTLLPGELSTRTSRLGILSPTLMKARDELWKVREVREAREPLRVNRRRARVEAMLKLAQLRSVDRLKVFVRDVIFKESWRSQPCTAPSSL